MRRIESHPSLGDKNSLWYWPKVVPWWRVARNFVVCWLCKGLPLRAKSWLYRRIGVKVGKNVSIGLSVTIDIFFPELIEIGDNTIVGYGTTILAHEFLQRECRTGVVKIGENVMIGANCTILPGVEIRGGSVVSACSLVNGDVDGKVEGVPIRPIER
jgi:acetyltransferase-like isoleucine patch superfamily enzyme